jgi:hypothetical protein
VRKKDSELMPLKFWKEKVNVEFYDPQNYNWYDILEKGKVLIW